MGNLFERLGSTLRGKVGGVPVWAIALVVGSLGTLAYWRFAMSGAANSEPAAEVAMDDPPEGDPVGVAVKVPFMAPEQSNGYAVYQPDDNMLWTRRVTEAFSAQGQRPDFVQSAIGKYLSGQDLTSDETRVVQEAIAAFGLPTDLPSEVGRSTTVFTPDKVMNIVQVEQLTGTSRDEIRSLNPAIGSYTDASPIMPGTSIRVYANTGAPIPDAAPTGPQAGPAGLSGRGVPLAFYKVPQTGSPTNPRRLANIATVHNMTPSNLRFANPSLKGKPDDYLVPANKTLKVYQR